MNTETITAKWSIEHSNFYGYVIGSDKCLYKLPYTKKQRDYGLRKLKIVEKTGTKGYFLFQGDDRYFWSLKQIKRLQETGRIIPIKYELILINNPKDMPWA